MTLQMYPVIISLIFFFGKSQECIQKNVSCNNIKTSNGFKFCYEGPAGSEISVFHNKTLIAYAVPSKQLVDVTNEVISIDNASVITRKCQDLQVVQTVPNGQRHVTDICLDFKITDKMKSLDPNDPSSREDSPPVGVSSGMIALIVIIVITVITVITCVLWSIRKVRGQNSAATVSPFIHLPACFCPEISQAETGEQETSELPSVPDQCGSDESHAEQDITLESVLVPSIDATENGETLQSDRLDCSESSEGIQTTNKDDISTPDVNRASNHLNMHRNLRDDPGGVNDNKGKEILREKHTGWTHGDRGREGHENEEQPLLVTQRAAIQSFDMAGEVLVNMPDADVESVPNMKNCT